MTHKTDHISALVRAWGPTIASRQPVLNEAGIKAGDIFVSAWGYDQTNISWYQVTEVKAKFVVVRRIEGKIVGQRDSGTTETVMPLVNKWRGSAERKKVKLHQGRPYLGISSYESAYLWDGKPKSQTNSMYGH